jgi:hypothetical protein
MCIPLGASQNCLLMQMYRMFRVKRNVYSAMCKSELPAYADVQNVQRETEMCTSQEAHYVSIK